MKKAVKIICLALALCLFITFFSFSAEEEIIFLAVNNTILRPLSRDNMPVYIGDEIYVPYSVLSSFGTIKYYYNRTLNQILVYDFWQRITFDLAEGRTFDEEGAYLDFNAVSQNGTVYLPLIVICSKFDFYISASHYSDYGTLIRVNEGDTFADDRQFTESVSNLLKRVYTDYIDSQKQTTPGPGTADPKPPQPPVLPKSRISYLMIKGDPASYGESALSSLGPLNAAFFLTAQQIQDNGAFVRRLISSGRTVGILLSASSDTSLTEQLNAANRALKSQTYTKSRLVCIDEGSGAASDIERDALISCGVRIWDPNLSVNGLRSTTIESRASGISSTVVFGLDITESSGLSYLSNLKKAITDNSYTLLHMDEWSTPLNTVNDIR